MIDPCASYETEAACRRATMTLAEHGLTLSDVARGITMVLAIGAIVFLIGVLVAYIASRGGDA